MRTFLEAQVIEHINERRRSIPYCADEASLHEDISESLHLRDVTRLQSSHEIVVVPQQIYLIIQ
jgi:hypothetical protein